MYLVKTEFKDQALAQSSVPQEASSSFILQSLDAPDKIVRFDLLVLKAEDRLADSETFKYLFETHGDWNAPPSHAVYAIWQITDPEREAAFIESRRQLFELRRQVLPTFACDWLLKHTNEAGQYMVLGLYGDEEGATSLCRDHPAIKKFAHAHSAKEYSAQDLTGVCCFRVVAAKN